MHKQLTQNQWPKYHLLNLQQSVFINDPRSYKRPAHKSLTSASCPTQETMLLATNVPASISIYQWPTHKSMTPAYMTHIWICPLHTWPTYESALSIRPTHETMPPATNGPSSMTHASSNPLHEALTFVPINEPFHQSMMIHALMTCSSKHDLYIN